MYAIIVYKIVGTPCAFFSRMGVVSNIDLFVAPGIGGSYHICICSPYFSRVWFRPHSKRAAFYLSRRRPTFWECVPHSDFQSASIGLVVEPPQKNRSLWRIIIQARRSNMLKRKNTCEIICRIHVKHQGQEFGPPRHDVIAVIHENSGWI